MINIKSLLIVLILVISGCTILTHPSNQYVIPKDRSCDLQTADECNVNSQCFIKDLDDVQNDDARPWTCCPKRDKIPENNTFSKDDPCSWIIG